MKILILSSLSWSLVNFRGALIAQMAADGHDVVACAPDAEPEVVGALSRMSVRFRLTRMARAGTNPLRDLMTLASYVRLMRQERPDVVVAYTQKPIIYGGLATRFFGRARFYAIMSGLGYVFSDEAVARRGLRRLVSMLYRTGVRHARCIFVFNGEDRRTMLANGIVDDRQRVVQVPGSGVDVKHYAAQPMPPGAMTFLMMGRLMRDKGVGEYIAAARLARARWPEARFLLLGRPETENPTGYTVEEMQAWQDEGVVELLAETRDVRPCLASAHVFVLPSYYREGLPRTILEALATGRPVITTDMPGCREPIEQGHNGFLVPPRDVKALSNAVERFLECPALLQPMGEAARQSAVNFYDVECVNRQLLSEMELIGPDAMLPPSSLPAAVDATIATA